MRRIDHVGVAVRDLDAARAVWDALLGQAPKTEEVPGQKVRTATYPCGIELIAPAAPDSPISGFLEKRGGGLHHVTLEVADLDAELARLKAQGARLLQEEGVPGAGGSRVAFLHPAAAGGVLLELKEKRGGSGAGGAKGAPGGAGR
jgi:methylmalonyl-CoA/ethylmalonyl-CoA epimerase